MIDDDRALRLLASIDRRLALLSAVQEREVRASLENDVLRTPARVTMFKNIDGQRGTAEIANAANVSTRAAQLFVKEMLDLGLVRDTGTGVGRAMIVEPDHDGITRWYIHKG